MGGPSSKEILSDDTLTKYIDGEIKDEMLLKLFERKLSKSIHLQNRLQDMVAVKSQISGIAGTEGLRITKFVKNEIRDIVKSYQLTDVFKDHDDGGATPSDAEVLISKLIDGELADNELQMVEKLVTDNDTYRELYEQLVTSKVNISDNLFQENTEPSAKVKMSIKSLVEHELGKPEDVGEQMVEALSMELSYKPTEPAQNVINLKKRGIVSSLNHYAQRLVPVAAVFALGLYISPVLFSSGLNQIPGFNSKTRSGGAQKSPDANFNFIETIKNLNEKNQRFIHFRLTAPTTGEMFIYLETSEQNDISKVGKGQLFQKIGSVRAGQSVRYPAANDICISEADQLLRVDIEIRGKDKIFSFTEFVAINDGQSGDCPS